MNIIQIYGTPCTGKSTFIKQLKQSYRLYCYDIIDYRDTTEDFLLAENLLLKDILNKIQKLSTIDIVIIESASGFYDLKSFNVKMMHASIEDLEKNHTSRNLELTDSLLNYYSQLDSISLPAHYEIVGYKQEYFERASELMMDYFYKWKSNN